MKLTVAGFVMVVFLASITWGQENECPQGICDLIDCVSVSKSECEGVFMKGGGKCGCCDGCFKSLGYGEACTLFDRANPPEGLCKNGYFCDNFKGRCTFLLPGWGEECTYYNRANPPEALCDGYRCDGTTGKCVFWLPG